MAWIFLMKFFAAIFTKFNLWPYFGTTIWAHTLSSCFMLHQFLPTVFTKIYFWAVFCSTWSTNYVFHYFFYWFFWWSGFSRWFFRFFRNWLLWFYFLATILAEAYLLPIDTPAMRADNSIYFCGLPFTLSSSFFYRFFSRFFFGDLQFFLFINRKQFRFPLLS